MLFGVFIELYKFIQLFKGFDFEIFANAIEREAIFAPAKNRAWYKISVCKG